MDGSCQTGRVSGTDHSSSAAAPLCLGRGERPALEARAQAKLSRLVKRAQERLDLAAPALRADVRCSPAPRSLGSQVVSSSVHAWQTRHLRLLGRVRPAAERQAMRRARVYPLRLLER